MRGIRHCPPGTSWKVMYDDCRRNCSGRETKGTSTRYKKKVEKQKPKILKNKTLPPAGTRSDRHFLGGYKEGAGGDESRGAREGQVRFVCVYFFVFVCLFVCVCSVVFVYLFVFVCKGERSGRLRFPSSSSENLRRARSGT